MVDTELLKKAWHWFDNAIAYGHSTVMSEEAKRKAVKVSLDRACDFEALAYGYPARYTMLGSLHGQGSTIPSDTPKFMPEILDPENTIIVGGPAPA